MHIITTLERTLRFIFVELESLIFHFTNAEGMEADKFWDTFCCVERGGNGVQQYSWLFGSICGNHPLSRSCNKINLFTECFVSLWS